MIRQPGTTVIVGHPGASVASELVDILQATGVLARSEATCEAFLAALEREAAGAAVIDAALTSSGGADALRSLQARWPDLPVVVVTDKVALGIQAVRAGAADFLRLPLDRDEVAYIVGKALASAEIAADEPPPSRIDGGDSMLGDSAPMRELRETIRRVAPSTATVLVRGEGGTGKELVARQLHEQSARRTGPFVKVHCAAFPAPLLESELFGYEEGAFTGAVARKAGRVELAEGGTLFLDEIGDVTPAVQVKLLRVLQDREYERLGGNQALRADVRFVAATHRDLDALVRSGTFREDLFYRLHVVPIVVPPLRARAEDVEILAAHFAHAVSAENGRAAVTFEPEALAALRRASWPGNVRQLQNFVERLVVLADGVRIGADAVDRELSGQAGALRTMTAEEIFTGGQSALTELATAVRKAEKRALEKALRHAQGNRNLAARLLGISRRTLYYKLQEHDLS